MPSAAAWRHEAEVEILVAASPTETTRQLCEELRAAGYRPIAVSSITAARRSVRDDNPQLAVIQLVLSDGCGLDLLAATQDAGVAAIIFSSDATAETIERSFRLGADDVVTAPLHVTGLVMRITAMLRRSGALLPSRIAFDGLDIDVEAREVTVNGAAVELTAMEFDLLAFFAAHPGRVFTRHQLLASVWHSSGEWQQPSTVTEHVRRLRARIEAEPATPRWLKTSRGVGYRFDRRPSSACVRPLSSGVPMPTLERRREIEACDA